MARKRTEPSGDPSCAHLEDRMNRLEKLITQHFGATMESLAEENPEDDEVVDEKRFERSVIRTHKSGKIEHVRICPHCKAEVHDLPAHLAVCRMRSAF